MTVLYISLERGGSIGRQFGHDRGQAPTGPKVCRWFNSALFIPII